MNVNEAQTWVSLGYDIKRKCWDNNTFIKGFRCAPNIDITHDNGKKFEPYFCSDEDYYATDWELKVPQTDMLPTLT